MAYSLTNIYTKNYWNRTITVKIVIGGWVVYFFWDTVYSHILYRYKNQCSQQSRRQKTISSKNPTQQPIGVLIFKFNKTSDMPKFLRWSHRLVKIIFTARRYAKRGICCRRMSVCVCVSVTLWYCIKTAKRRITQIMPHDSYMTLVFWCEKSWRNSNEITPYGGDKCRWGGL